MPRVKCPKCSKDETILKDGFVRGVQRYFCKECDYRFTLFKKKLRMASQTTKRHQTTIIDIAKAAGISVSTVSRALKNHPDISVQTKAVVKQIAKEMDYQPNLIAQSLNSRETHTLGVIVPDIENPFFASILSSIQHTASVSGYKVMICQSNESHKAEVEHVQMLMTNWVDGLLICHSKETVSFEHIKLQLKKGIPIIHFDRVCEEVDTPKVLLDDINGAEQITEHLIQQGCNKIAVIAGPKHLLITRRRLQGYQNALQKHQIIFNQDLIAYTDFTKKSIHVALNTFLGFTTKPDAIFCISDSSAIHTILYLKSQKIKIPEQICVAGFGNDHIGEVIEPGLTSFDLHSSKVGQAAVELFFDKVINGDNLVDKVRHIKGELIIRSSSLRIKR